MAAIELITPQARPRYDASKYATPCSSTKGWTGHTLGAAGIVESAIALLCIAHGLIPQSLNTRERDPQLRGNIVTATRAARVERVISNSFGFGGSNCSLLFGKAAHKDELGSGAYADDGLVPRALRRLRERFAAAGHGMTGQEGTR